MQTLPMLFLFSILLISVNTLLKHYKCCKVGFCGNAMKSIFEWYT